MLTSCYHFLTCLKTPDLYLIRSRAAHIPGYLIQRAIMPFNVAVCVLTLCYQHAEAILSSYAYGAFCPGEAGAGYRIAMKRVRAVSSEQFFL